MNPYARAALVGAATGGRTFTGLAALALTTPEPADTQPDRTLATPWVKGGVAVLAAQELVMDKLPNTPSRLDPPGLPMRGVAAVGAGVIVAARREAPDQLPVVIGVPAPAPPGTSEPEQTVDGARVAGCVAASLVAAAAGAWLGSRFRGWAAARLPNDYLGAAVEDAAVICLAWLGARDPSRNEGS